MRHLWLSVGLLGLLMSSPVWAASYQDRWATVHDPILDTGGTIHPYSGPDLILVFSAPGADLSHATMLGEPSAAIVGCLR